MAAGVSGASLESTLDRKFQNVTNTMDSIQGLSSWCIENKKCHSLVVRHWMKWLRKSDAPHRLNLLYLANDIIQNCKRKNAMVYRTAFAEVLPDAFLLVNYDGDSKVMKSVERILSIWEDRSVYSGTLIAELRNSLVKEDSPPETPIEQKTPVESTAELHSKVVAEFVPQALIDQLSKYKKSLEEVDLTEKQLTAMRVDIFSSNALKKLKDKAGGKKFSKDFEEGSAQLQEFVKFLERQSKGGPLLLEALTNADIFYELQYKEVKIVANAYQAFANRVSHLKRKLDNLKATLPDLDESPIPSPSADAPSPTGSESPFHGLELSKAEPDADGSAVDDDTEAPAPSPLSSPGGSPKCQEDHPAINVGENDNREVEDMDLSEDEMDNTGIIVEDHMANLAHVEDSIHVSRNADPSLSTKQPDTRSTASEAAPVIAPSITTPVTTPATASTVATTITASITAVPVAAPVAPIRPDSVVAAPTAAAPVKAAPFAAAAAAPVTVAPLAGLITAAPFAAPTAVAPATTVPPAAAASVSAPVVTAPSPAAHVAPVRGHTTKAPFPAHGAPTHFGAHGAPPHFAAQATPAPFEAHGAPAHFTAHAVTAPFEAHGAPAHFAAHTAPAPVVAQVAPGPLLAHATSAPLVDHSAPAPVTSHITPATVAVPSSGLAGVDFNKIGSILNSLSSVIKNTVPVMESPPLPPADLSTKTTPAMASAALTNASSLSNLLSKVDMTPGDLLSALSKVQGQSRRQGATPLLGSPAANVSTDYFSKGKNPPVPTSTPASATPTMVPSLSPVAPAPFSSNSTAGQSSTSQAPLQTSTAASALVQALHRDMELATELEPSDSLESKIHSFLQENPAFNAFDLGFSANIGQGSENLSPVTGTDTQDGTPVRDEGGGTPTQDEVMDKPVGVSFVSNKNQSTIAYENNQQISTNTHQQAHLQPQMYQNGQVCQPHPHGDMLEHRIAKPVLHYQQTAPVQGSEPAESTRDISSSKNPVEGFQGMSQSGWYGPTCPDGASQPSSYNAAMLREIGECKMMEQFPYQSEQTERSQEQSPHIGSNPSSNFFRNTLPPVPKLPPPPVGFSAPSVVTSSATLPPNQQPVPTSDRKGVGGAAGDSQIGGMMIQDHQHKPGFPPEGSVYNHDRPENLHPQLDELHYREERHHQDDPQFQGDPYQPSDGPYYGIASPPQRFPRGRGGLTSPPLPSEDSYYAYEQRNPSSPHYIPRRPPPRLEMRHPVSRPPQRPPQRLPHPGHPPHPRGSPRAPPFPRFCGPGPDPWLRGKRPPPRGRGNAGPVFPPKRPYLPPRY
ncbi:regulation of nuclear pre-mRNA domain-containing protein 2a [Thalassophryne amazonica]|uniref:regulation of nuclear pre-mRNA domain-containing protein 2a n=1 Tax=Thalassophryne amazonica TaxID=390379 RepID=UPI0014725C2B|nr:regulation of nuclear pre-mRNA domain-containing protein 2a [Thalassophryne amazonica]